MATVDDEVAVVQVNQQYGDMTGNRCHFDSLRPYLSHEAYDALVAHRFDERQLASILDPQVEQEMASLLGPAICSEIRSQADKQLFGYPSSLG